MKQKILFESNKGELAYRAYMGKEKSYVVLEMHKDNFEVTLENEKYLCLKIPQGSQLFRALNTIDWKPPKVKDNNYQVIKFIEVEGKQIY